METATQETETKELTLKDENISQADYERLRSGEKVEVKSEIVAQDAIVESEDDESETSETDEDEDDIETTTTVHKKPARGFKKRIEKLNARLSEANAQAEHWRQQAMRVQEPEKQEETPVVSESEPSSDDYETATEFYRAHARWAVQEETKAVKEAERQEKLKATAETKKQEFQGRVQEFSKAHDDFHETIADVDDIQMSLAISNAILESDNGPELMYELARNREEYARICALSPFEAVRALGRFEARLQKPSEEKVEKPIIKTKTTKAPPPAKPISTSSANGKKSVYDDNISQAEYERMRSEQEKRRRV